MSEPVKLRQQDVLSLFQKEVKSVLFGISQEVLNFSW